MLDLRRLQIFREVARRRSFSAAADALTYTQPAVSHHVSRLELELGAKLLVRSKREPLALTPAGELLLAHAEALLAQMEQAELELAELLGETTSKVRLAAFATACATIVPQAIAAARAVSPEIQFTLFEGEPDEALAALVGRRVDLAMLFDDGRHLLPIDDAVTLELLLEDRMVIALPAAHQLADRDPLRLADFEDEPWIEAGGAAIERSVMLADACARAGFEPHVAFNSGNLDAVQELVAAGVGVALIPELAITHLPAEVVVRTVDLLPSRRIFVGTRRGGTAAAARTVVAALRDVASKRSMSSSTPRVA